MLFSINICTFALLNSFFLSEKSQSPVLSFAMSVLKGAKSEMEQRQLVWLITERSGVRFPLSLQYIQDA